MEDIILLSCILIIVHILCPVIIGLLGSKEITIGYLFSSRDKDINVSKIYDRSKRSFLNLFETFPIFVMIILMSMIKNIDNYELGLYWIVLRFVYIPIYIAGLDYIRTIVWMFSFGILVLMGLKFL